MHTCKNLNVLIMQWQQILEQSFSQELDLDARWILRSVVD